jgi:hypothetical protein
MELAKKEGLVFAVRGLTPYARWITPEPQKKRFNTRFFLARLPEGQEASHDEVELVTSLWIAPGRALERQAREELMLMPPTLKTLEELLEFDTLDGLFSAADEKRLYPILPQPFQAEGGFGVMLPHDPEYRIPGHKQPPRPGETSRVVMKDGRWRTEKP